MSHKTGFVLGKFMPPHKGHVYLCEFARQYCDELVILVASQPDEPIPGKLRYQWMKQLFPTCKVVWIDRTIQQEPDGPDDDAFWAKWKGMVGEAMRSAAYLDSDGEGLGGINWSFPDYVFASEDYGHKLAASVKAQFVPCDILRQVVPVSGTKCREQTDAHWDYLPDIVKPYFVKRVTMFGPESTGKTTLGLQLAAHYKTILVPEYGRTYTETFGSDVQADDLMNIVAGHRASLAAAMPASNRILIEDTDPVMTAVWSDMLVGKRDPWFKSFDDYPSLYLLCDVDIPWVDDGTRYFKNDADRKRFFEKCKFELWSRGVHFEIISGNAEERLARAIEAIDNRLLTYTPTYKDQ